MKRFVIYSTLVIGIVGTAALWMMKRPAFAIGWWIGIVVGMINFSSLLSNVERSREEAQRGSQTVISKLRQRFFVRYLALALAFFLILQLGKEQLGSALSGFLIFYVLVVVDYFFRLRKQGVAEKGRSSLL